LENVQPDYNRSFPYNDLARRTIGFYDYKNKNDKNNNSYGIEKSFDSLLTGKQGSIKNYIGIHSKRLSKEEKKAESGADIILTLDMDLQDIVANCLMEGIKINDAERACAVVMEVETGEIKAMANIGRGLTEKSIDEIDGGNMAITSCNELGSVFKIPSIMVALENRIVTPFDSINAETTIYNVSDGRHRQKGKLPVWKIITESTNVGVANVICDAYYNNQDAYIEQIKKMRFDAPMNLQLPYARQPRIVKPTSKGDFSKRVIGYFNVPPIYMLRFYNAIANNGKMINPIVVKQVGNKKYSAETVTNKICSDKTIRQVQDMLLQAVLTGTAKSYKSNAVLFAGKTGTADILSDGASQGTFCGYFPVDTINHKKPEYSCIVVMYKRTNNNLWGKESCSVFKNIAEKITACKYKDKLSNKQKSENPLFFKNSKNDITKIDIKNNTVPDIIGTGARSAVYLLEKSGYIVQKINGMGTVKEVIRNGKYITLNLN
jgi:cell division protein FtsI (penicillin-binding protein 3)